MIPPIIKVSAQSGQDNEFSPFNALARIRTPKQTGSPFEGPRNIFRMCYQSNIYVYVINTWERLRWVGDGDFVNVGKCGNAESIAHGFDGHYYWIMTISVREYQRR